MRTRSPLSQPISNSSEHQRLLEQVNGDPTIMPAVLAVPGVTIEQEVVCLHLPVDPLDVHWRCALFASLAPDHSLDAAIAIGRLTGNCVLDLSQQLVFQLGPSPSACTIRFRARHPSDSAILFTKCLPERMRAIAIAVFGCARSSMSRRVSFSSVFLPNNRCSSRTGTVKLAERGLVGAELVG